MKIQWQARTFHSFGDDGLENIIVYDVPFDGDFDFNTMKDLNNKIKNGKYVSVDVVDNTTLRIAVKFD
jgi:hypothetical protein